jgi:hypothetical protein
MLEVLNFKTYNLLKLAAQLDEFLQVIIFKV